MTARVLMLLKSPGMLPFSLSNKRRPSVLHVNRPLFQRHYRFCPMTSGSRMD